MRALPYRCRGMIFSQRKRLLSLKCTEKVSGVFRLWPVDLMVVFLPCLLFMVEQK